MNTSLFDDLLIIFGASVLVSGLFGRLGLAPLLGYLLVGLMCGPKVLGLLSNIEQIQGFAEFGIVFLLFTLGLEFSIPKMLALRKAVFGLGSLQVVACHAFFTIVGWLLGLPLVGALLVGGALALSSTAIVSKELLRHNELNRHHGQLAFGVLLFQDMAAVLFILLSPILAGAGTGDASALLFGLLARGALLFAALIAIGHWILPWLFEQVSRAGGEELLVLAALVVALFAGWLTHLLGLPMSLGAFIAGITLGESRYRHQIEADIRPFRDVLLGLFFVGVGALLDAPILLAHGPALLLATLVLLCIKAALIALLARALGETAGNSVRVGGMLAQGGEFAFVLFNLAQHLDLLDSARLSFVSGMVIVSMLATPISIRCGHGLADWLREHERTPNLPGGANLDSLRTDTELLTGHVLICGYGRVGQTVARFLRRFDIPFVALDSDPLRVREAVEAGENVFIGDSRRRELLRAIGIERVRLVVISFSENAQRSRTLSAIRGVRHDVPILVRTSDDSELQSYLDQGASEVVPETLEGALMLVSHVLAMLGVPIGQIIRSIDKARRERYQILHGFFQGEQTRLIDEEGRKVKILHAIPLPENAAAVGCKLADLRLDELSVHLRAIQRDDLTEQAAPPEFEFRAGDTVILYGEPDHIEQAERRLLIG